MTIFEAGKKLTMELESLYNNREAKNIANLVMEKLTGFSKSERLVSRNKILNVQQQQLFQNHSQRLLQYTPVQYVLNEAWFYGMPFYVDENVLIPRPETEELVEAIINRNSLTANKTLSILDIGTGSGCIAISLKKKLPNSNVYALDISEKSIEIAHKNALKNNTEIEFFHANILKFNKYNNLPQIDVIVSNPPYICQSESAEISPNVLQYEPAIALFVPDDDPLLFYNAIADFASVYLKPGGHIFFEINELFGDKVAALLLLKNFTDVNIIKDLQQKNRIVSATIKTEYL